MGTWLNSQAALDCWLLFNMRAHLLLALLLLMLLLLSLSSRFELCSWDKVIAFVTGARCEQSR